MFLKDRILKMLNFLYKTAGVSSGWFLRPVNILSGCYTDTVMNLSAQLRHLSSCIHNTSTLHTVSVANITPVTATTTSVVPPCYTLPYHDMAISISCTWSYVGERDF